MADAPRKQDWWAEIERREAVAPSRGAEAEWPELDLASPAPHLWDV